MEFGLKYMSKTEFIMMSMVVLFGNDYEELKKTGLSDREIVKKSMEKAEWLAIEMEELDCHPWKTDGE